MLYFFMTAGSLPEKDYVWWKFDSQKLSRAKPEELPRVDIDPHHQFTDWLDGDPTRFSLLLAHDKDNQDNRLFLVICNLETKRQDHQRRMIRNTIVLVSKSPKDDQTIRWLASACLDDALFDTIAETLDKALKERIDSNENWLDFDDKNWNAFLKSDYLKQESNSSVMQGEKLIIARDSKEQRESIKSFLLQQCELPRKPILVVVTGFKSPEFYEKYSDSICFALTEIEVSNKSRNKSDQFLEPIAATLSTVKKTVKKFIGPIGVTIVAVILGYTLYDTPPATFPEITPDSDATKTISNPILNAHLTQHLNKDLTESSSDHDAAGGGAETALNNDSSTPQSADQQVHKKDEESADSNQFELANYCREYEIALFCFDNTRSLLRSHNNDTRLLIDLLRYNQCCGSMNFQCHDFFHIYHNYKTIKNYVNHCQNRN